MLFFSFSFKKPLYLPLNMPFLGAAAFFAVAFLGAAAFFAVAFLGAAAFFAVAFL